MANCFLKKYKTEHFISGYTQLNYIESDGSQYINLNYTPSENFRFDIDAEMLDVSDGCVLFGYVDFAGSRDYKTLVATGGSSNKVVVAAGTTNEDIYGIRPSERHTYRMEHYMVWIDGYREHYDDVHEEQGTPLNASSMYLFRAHRTGDTDNDYWTGWQSARVYEIKIYNNGSTLSRHLVPALRKSDGKAGLIDILSNTFYAPSSGNLAYG